MQALAYYITLPLIHVVARLPFPLLYLLSDLTRLALFGMIGYRRQVVWKNLKNSFPEKTDQEISSIRKDFEVWFCDLVFETIKTLTIGPEALQKRMQFEEQDLVRAYRKENQSIIAVIGHLGNWELAAARYGLEKDMPLLCGIYHPLKNKHFDRLIHRMRTKQGTKLYAMQETTRAMFRDRDLNTTTVFIADQTPSPKRAYWLTFMNQDTPVFLGAETIAKKFNYPVVYVSISRPERGHYVMRTELLVKDPVNTVYGEITEKHTRRLEQDIRNSPDIWLWTHRRWKHKRPPTHE